MMHVLLLTHSCHIECAQLFIPNSVILNDKISLVSSDVSTFSSREDLLTCCVAMIMTAPALRQLLQNNMVRR